MAADMGSVFDPQVRLHIVTGKGGTGKTTIAAALAVALASRGKRVLLAEVEGRSAIASTFDIPALSSREQLIARIGEGAVYGLAVDAREALIEYLAKHYHLGRAGKTLQALGALDFATTVAPGVRDLLLLGKVYEATNRRTSTKAARRGGTVSDTSFAYDAVVLDAPPIGRIASFVNISESVGQAARVGPIHAQSRAITELAHSPACAVHITTLLEEMSVAESAEAVQQWQHSDVRIGVVFANQVHTKVGRSHDSKPAADGDIPLDDVRAGLRSLGLADDEQTAAALLATGQRYAHRLALEKSMMADVKAFNLPIVVIPRVLEPRGLAGLGQIATHMCGGEQR